ncbi:MAG: ACT domain-containing protein [Neisseriaceae bacterium]|jgi:acetolactate synthase small subunit|nr:MAG: ACT domain-containing protein [Neisseriaceae bacterium]
MENHAHDMHIINIVTRNSLRVLQRISGLFSRYGVNIDQMSIFSGQDALSYFSVIVYSDDHSIQKLTNQLNKIVEVCEVRVANQKHF